MPMNCANCSDIIWRIIFIATITPVGTINMYSEERITLSFGVSN